MESNLVNRSAEAGSEVTTAVYVKLEGIEEKTM